VLFEQALQIVNNIIAQVSMTRQGHFEAQQAIAALEQNYKKAMDEVERLRLVIDKSGPPVSYRD